MQRIKELYPSKTVAKTVPAAKVAKPVHKPTINVKTVQKINKPESGVPKDTITKEKITPVAEAKPEKLYELSPLLSKALEEELQQIMVKVWEDHDEPCSDTEKLVAERFKAETEDDLKNVLGLNATKRLLNVYNPLFVMVEFNRKPDGDGLRSFVRWMNCVALKRVNDGSEHKYCAQLKKMADYERVSSKSVIKFSNLTVKLTPTYKFTECPTNLKTIYKMNKLKRKPNLNIQDVSKDSTTANTAKIEENSEAKRVKTEKNTDKKVEPLKTVAKSQTVKQPAGAPQKQEAKPPVKKTGSITNPTVNNKAPTKTEVTKPTPPKQLDQPPKVVEKSKPNLVNKATAVTKPVAKSVNTTTAASKTVNTATAATKPVDKAAAVTKPVNTTTAATKSVNTATAATKPVDKATAVTKPVNTTTAATKPVNTATAATKPVNTATAVTKPVKTANTVTKPISKPVNTAPAVTKPIAKPVNKTTAATKPIAKPVNKTTAVTNVREKKKERKPGDFDELDDEDILALMSNAIVLDECSGSDDEV